MTNFRSTIVILIMLAVMLLPAGAYAVEQGSASKDKQQVMEEKKTEKTQKKKTAKKKKVVAKKTIVTGLALEHTRKARGVITDTITVKNAGGRKIRLKRWDSGSGTWITSKVFQTKKAGTQKIKIRFSSKWWKKTHSSWRIEMVGTKKYKAYKSPVIKVTTKRYYQNPSEYYQLHTGDIEVDGGGYTLKKGCMGFKVQKVNSYFGIGDRNWPRYSETTRSCVKSFQRAHGLDVTGNVNKATWMKIGDVRERKKGSRGAFTEDNWYHLGSYTYPNRTTLTMSRSDCVDRFIKTAYQYLDSDYVVGGSGRPGQGADCSGIVMQCMYSCGIDPSPVSSVRHSQPGYEYESRNLWTSSKLKKVSFENRKRGDLIFYSSNGIIIHVAIYLGDNKIIHSWPDDVRVSSVYGWGTIAGARRVFN